MSQRATTHMQLQLHYVAMHACMGVRRHHAPCTSTTLPIDGRAWAWMFSTAWHGTGACELWSCPAVLLPAARGCRNKALLIVEVDGLMYGWLRTKLFQAITTPSAGMQPAGAGAGAQGGDEKEQQEQAMASQERWLYVFLVSAGLHDEACPFTSLRHNAQPALLLLLRNSI